MFIILHYLVFSSGWSTMLVRFSSCFVSMYHTKTNSQHYGNSFTLPGSTAAMLFLISIASSPDSWLGPLVAFPNNTEAFSSWQFTFLLFDSPGVLQPLIDALQNKSMMGDLGRYLCCALCDTFSYLLSLQEQERRQRNSPKTFTVRQRVYILPTRC